MRKDEQKKIDEAEPLTEEEIAEKEDLLKQVCDQAANLKGFRVSMDLILEGGIQILWIRDANLPPNGGNSLFFAPRY